MLIFHNYLVRLTVVHLAWFYFFTTGQLLRPKAIDAQSEDSIVDLVMLSLSGLGTSNSAIWPTVVMRMDHNRVN
jgi:hypothetical protein